MKQKYLSDFPAGVRRRVGWLFVLALLLLAGCSAAGLQHDEAAPTPFEASSPAVVRSQDFEDEINRDLAVAYALIESGQLHEAQAQLGSVLERDPGNGWAMLNLGVTLQRMGLYPRAREVYLQVLALPKGGQLTARALSQAGAGRSLQDLARHNLRSVNSLLQQEQLQRERSIVASQTGVGAPGAGFESAAAKPELSPQASAAGVSADPALFDQQVLGVVEAWRGAWIGRRVAEYLAHYLPDFTPGGLSHAQWRESRQARLLGARGVSIEFDELRVHRLSDQMARVIFKQSYRDQRYADVGCKTLVLQQHEGSWKIRAEGFVKVTAEARCE